MAKVIYLTGAPAAGKSSTSRLLKKRIPGLQVWEYGARLTAYCAAKDDTISGQDVLRSRSSSVVSPDDVAAVDDALLAFVDHHRPTGPILIDSHPVTKEAYGFRITAFEAEQVKRLRPTEVWVLYADPPETRRRIQDDPAGRPKITSDEAMTHTLLQASVAAQYGVICGCPVYLFDTAQSRDALIDRLVGRLS